MKISVIGQGYVGLPLSLAISKKYNVIGYDINLTKIRYLKKKKDPNNEISKSNFINKKIKFSNNIEDLSNSNYFIIAVPTPVDVNNKPDLYNLKSAIKSVGKFVKNNSTIIIESTVYPGFTDEVCKPMIEKISNLKCIKEDEKKGTKGFYLGFCPERVNPGDRKHTIDKITKVISGSCKIAIKKIKKIYKVVNGKNIYVADNIKVAESAKIIENTQRDLNIALINELSKIFNLMNIDTNAVLKTANTKWNFLDFKPGLVGGHCIGVDPYYLTYKSKKLGYKPDLILSGRKMNDGIPEYLSQKIKKIAKLKKIKSSNIKCLIIGVSFKENVSDIRNSKAIELVKLLKKKYIVDLYDPIINEIKVENCLVYKKLSNLKNYYYNCIIISVPHKTLINDLKKIIKIKSKKIKIIIDIKSVLDKKISDFRL